MQGLSPKAVEQADRLKILTRADVAALSPKAAWRQNSFLHRNSMFALTTFNWLDEAHLHYQYHLLSLNLTDLNVNHIFKKKNTFRAIFIDIWKTARHYSLVKWTYKNSPLHETSEASMMREKKRMLLLNSMPNECQHTMHCLSAPLCFFPHVMNGLREMPRRFHSAY